MAKPDHAATLLRIAAVLGISADSFRARSTKSVDSGGATELLTLWNRIATVADQAQLLAVARALAAGDGTTEPARRRSSGRAASARSGTFTPTETERGYSLRFDHVANRVNPDHFETVVDLFVEQLGFVELRRTERAVWLRQPGANVDLQLSRSDTGHRDEDRARSQVSFLSDTPEAELQRLALWFKARGLPAHVGAYSDKEFYLDVPPAFVDFVVEAMLPELAAYDLAAR